MEIHGWISSIIDTLRNQGLFICHTNCSLSYTLSLSTLNHSPCFHLLPTYSLYRHCFLFFLSCNSCDLCTSFSHSIYLFSITFSPSVSASWQDGVVSGPASSASLCGTGWASPEWPSVDPAAALFLVLLPCRRRPPILLSWLGSLCYISLLQLLSC